MAETGTSGTETAEVETGDHEATAAEAPETATEPKAGEQTDEAKAAEAEATAAAERERQVRESTPGTVEYREKQALAAIEARKKMGITLTKAEERALKAETEAKVLREMLDKVGKQPAKTEPAATEKPLVRPRMKDFEDEDDYQAALDKYDAAKEEQIIAKAEAKARERVQQEHDQGRVKTEREKAAQEWDKKVEGFHAKGATIDPDFTETVQAAKFISPVMAGKMFKLEHGPDVALHLARNQEEAQKIAVMDPVDQVDAIAELHDKIKAAKQPRETKAPAPIKPVNGGASALTVDTSKMSDAEWHEWKKKQNTSSA